MDVPRFFTAHGGADAFLESMRAHRSAARDAIAVAQHQQAQAYNQGRRELDLQPDDLVLLKPHSLELIESKGAGVKLVQRALGPFAVQERVGDATYRVDLPPEFPMSNVIHVSHLRKYITSPPRFGERTTLPSPRFVDEENDEYQVERIVAHRNNRRRKQMEYLVRWEGFGPQHDSWLTAKELRNAPARLLDYRRQHGV